MHNFIRRNCGNVRPGLTPTVIANSLQKFQARIVVCRARLGFGWLELSQGRGLGLGSSSAQAGLGLRPRLKEENTPTLFEVTPTQYSSQKHHHHRNPDAPHPAGDLQ